MSTAVMTERLGLNSVAESALKAAAVFWFLVAVIGQWIFVVYIVSFSGRSVVEGDLARWNFIPAGILIAHRESVRCMYTFHVFSF